MQTLEGIATVEHATVIYLAQVTLDVAAGECGAAEQYGNSREALVVQFFEVFAHDERALHQETAHAECIGLNFLHLGNHLADGNLDADVVHLVAVVCANDVDQVLADVVHVALHGGQHEFSFARRTSNFVHVRLEVADSSLHRLGTLQDEGQLHLAGTEQFAHLAHAVEQHVVDDLERLQALTKCLIEFGAKTFTIAIDDALTQSLTYRPAAAVWLFLLGRLDAFECRQQQLQRVVVGCGLVEDDVAAQCEMLGLDARERQNLARVHDRRVEPGFHALIQKHTVQHLARSRIDAETHV